MFNKLLIKLGFRQAPVEKFKDTLNEMQSNVHNVLLMAKALPDNPQSKRLIWAINRQVEVIGRLKQHTASMVRDAQH